MSTVIEDLPGVFGITLCVSENEEVHNYFAAIIFCY
jgi:hypothetical protein